ncbi:MAG: hypothetical protein HRT35_29705, partial [Algicola sp.]|nr:hypothetical protein [Algicola sp.]
IHDGRVGVSIVSAAALDTDDIFGISEEAVGNQIILANDLRLSDGATVYIDRDETAANPATAPVANIEIFTEQGEVFSNGTKSNRYHSDIGAAHAYSCPTAALPVADTSAADATIQFTISETGYSVYQTVSGTLYLISDNGVDVYMIVGGNGTRVILQSSMAQFFAANASMHPGYNVLLEDKNGDGKLDLFLQPINDSVESMLIVSHLSAGSPYDILNNLNRIIFVHTDLLGSPVAQTDINGKVL